MIRARRFYKAPGINRRRSPVGPYWRAQEMIVAILFAQRALRWLGSVK